MKSERRRQTILWVGSLLLASSSRSPAQTVDRSAEVHHRNQCRRAAQVIESGHPANRRAWARRYISSCGDQGPVVLAAQWERVGSDSGEVAYLVLALLEQIAAARTTERLPGWYAAAVPAKRVRFDIEAGRAR